MHHERNLGYASNLINELTDYLFLNYNIKSIKLDISPDNKSSINVAVKCGFILDEDDFANRNYSNKMIFVKDSLCYENKRKI